MPRSQRPKADTRRTPAPRSPQPAAPKPAPTFDEITRLARELFHSEMAAMSLVEDQLHAFAAGPDAPVERRRVAPYCADTVLLDGPSGAAASAANPLVVSGPTALLHARGPLVDGDPCVLGREPREARLADLDALRDLGRTLERQIESFEATSFDELTGLANRSGLLSIGQEMLAISLSADEGAALLFIGLEGVPRIRDRFGVKAGDQALRDLARILEGNFRGSDLVASLGGDEFCVLMTPYSDQTDDFTAAARLHAAITRYNESAGVPWSLRISVGGARCLPGMGLDRLLSLADARMIDACARTRALRQ